MTQVSERLRARPDVPPAEHSPASADAASEALLAPLPAFAREAFVRHAAQGASVPRDAADLFEQVEQWTVGAGIAEGRGGYPGGRGKPGWTDYVELQRKHVAIFRALVDVFGEPSPSLAATFRDHERRFSASVRRMGEGYEPHVDDVAGRLVYSLPVDSSFVTVAFAFPVVGRDLDILSSDPYRRAVLEVVAHTVLQRSMIRGNPEVTESVFGRIVNAALHSTADELRRFVAGIDRDHNTRVEIFAQAAMQRRSAAAEPRGGAGDEPVRTGRATPTLTPPSETAS